MATNRTHSRADKQGHRWVGRHYQETCSCFLIKMSAFLVKEEAGSSAGSEDGEKVLEV